MVLFGVCLVISCVIGVGYAKYKTSTVNGIMWGSKTVDEMEAELSKVEKTVVMVENDEVDITECLRIELGEVEHKFGDSKVDVKKTLQRSEARTLLEKYELAYMADYKVIDFEALFNACQEGSTVKLEDYVKNMYSDKIMDKYERIKSFTYSYTKDVKQIDVSKYVKIEKSKVVTDWSFIDKIVSSVQKKYNTFGDPVKFKTHSGKKITLDTPDSMWGDLVDVDAEKAFLQEACKKGKKVKNREPIFTQRTGKLGNSYIEVSISQQKVWLVKDGKVKMSSSCVTGTKGSHDTPRGVYYILEYKPNGKVLRGDDYATPVSRWLRLTWTGVGLHDASWRGSFGGNIYTYNGSHGCINLPFSFADKLLKAVKWGFPAVVY